MDLKDIFYEQIVSPFFEEITLRNQLNGLDNFNNYVDVKYAQTTRESCIKIVKQNLFVNSISSYNFDKPRPSKEELTKRIKELMLVEILFRKKLIDVKKKTIDEQIKDLFVYLLGIQTYMSSYRLEQINEINIYIDFAIKMLKIFRDNEQVLTEKDKRWYNFLKRCIYLTIHETRFELKEEKYNYCIKLVIEDIKYSKEISLKEYIFALSNYVIITLDHLLVSINSPVEYIRVNEYKSILDQLKKQCIKMTSEPNQSNFRIYKIFSILFQDRLYELKKSLKDKKEIKEKDKIVLLIQCSELIKAFYGNCSNFQIFVNLTDDLYSTNYNNALKLFSVQLSFLINEKKLNIMDPLFIVFNFLSNFVEFLKLNVNIYNRITFVSKNFFYRKIYLLSTILYLKSFNDIEKFKKEIVKVKRNIELNPIISLISLYNNEIASVYDLPPNLVNYYKADTNIIQIHEKIYFVNKLLFTEINKYKNNFLNDKNFKVKMNFLFNLQNEIKNILNVVTDPSIIVDLAQFYSFFMDNFIKNEGMDYREDFINKATIVKMTILDINPLNFSLALLFSKIGKIKLILNHPNPAQLGIRKKMLTHLEKQELGGYLQHTPKYFPKEEGRFNWGSIGNALDHLRDPAVTEDDTAPPDSRLLKIVCAILNKITRQDIQLSSIFPTLLEESYVHTKKIWDLDPILIFYFNSYFARIGKKIFINENTGEKIEVQFNSISSSFVFQKINEFIKDLLEYTKVINDDITAQFEELAKSNEEFLLDEIGKKKNIGLLAIKSFIQGDKTATYEKPYIGRKDQVYLFDILNNYLTAIGKLSLSQTFKFILLELIGNANKANIKRAHFLGKNLKISQNYDLGMINFIEYKDTKLSDYMEILKKNNFKIKLSFRVFNDMFIISISNNFKIHPREIKLLDNSVQNSKRCKNLKDAYRLTGINTKEGKGYGIIIILLLLRKFGRQQFFKVNIKENETIVTITIPFNLITEKQEKILATEITKEINDIPMIPDSIQKLKKKVKDPEVKLEDLEKLILKDPSLSADIIRRANSSFYMLQHPVEKVIDGIKIIGTKGLENILSIYASYKLLENKASQEKILEIIDHSELTAFYAKELSKILKIEINIDDIYLASLLHDIGKIIVEGLNTDIYVKIQNTMTDRSIPIEVLEDLAGGYDHALIGNLISKKWKFPEIVSEVIRCHHNPRDAKSHPQAVFLVYLANAFTYYMKEKILYENMDLNVLEYFEIDHPDKIKELSEKLQKAEKVFL